MIALKVIHINHGNSLAHQLSVHVNDIRDPEIQSSFESFEGIPHRLEKFAKTNGVIYVNDAKAVNVNSTWYSLESTPGPIVWIVGGVDKGNDYSQLVEVVSQKVKGIICLGTDNTKIVRAFKDIVPIIEETQSMREAVKHAYFMSKPGDYVLMSPSCASFDLFENFEDKGNQFKHYTTEL